MSLKANHMMKVFLHDHLNLLLHHGMTDWLRLASDELKANSLPNLIWLLIYVLLKKRSGYENFSVK